MAQVANAANQCMLGPVSVPALSGPPEWEDFNADGAWRTELHDPRWSGSPIQYLTQLPVGGSPTSAQEVSMRAVAVGKIVYVSLQAENDSDGPTTQDFVYVAFSDGNLAGAEAVTVNLGGGGTTINPPAGPGGGVVVPADSPLPTELAAAAVTYYHSDNARTDLAHPTVEPVWGGENDGIPTWLKGARWDRPMLGSPRWAITLKLDLSAMGGATNFFFGAAVHNGSVGDVIVGNATPKVGTDPDKLDITPIPKRSDLWPLYDAPGSACTGGITVEPGDIGTWTGTPGTYTPGSLTHQICTGSAACTTTENTFRVTARHVPNAGGISPWDVRARVRIAAWGSQPMYWNDALWQDVSTTLPKGTDILLGPTTPFTTGNGWYWATPVDAGDGTSSVTIDYKCTKGTDPFCPKLADMTELHQCILAEIAQPSGAWAISNAGAYQNMDYQTLSSHEREATISIAGLKAILGEDKDRDVYLYIDEHNLPATGEKAFELPLKDMERARELAEHPIRLPTLPGKPLPPPIGIRGPIKPVRPVRPVLPLKPPGNTPNKPGTVAPIAPPATNLAGGPARLSPELLERSERLIKSTEVFKTGLPVNNTLAMSGEQVLDAVWPTYRVRVYFDSGKTFTEHGHTNIVLVPMTPFGLRLQHAGSLYGFKHAFSGLGGAVFTKIDEHWFKIHMKSESSIKGLAQIAAVDTLPGAPPPVHNGPPPVHIGEHHGCSCRVVQTGSGDLGWLAAAFGLSMLTFARRRRNRR
ncbi:MAG TPA: hypothetical protein VHW01_03840 [Polyangiaceae bacterium]|nr:hypothetical protein [Polyangiaceae bacterium]